MTTLVVLQPGYLPWLGYFDQMRRADVFIHYDDVRFDKNGWRNRNRIKTQSGPQWLSVPVRHGDHTINQVQIDQSRPWPRKHMESLRQAYGAAPYAARYLPELAEILVETQWSSLVELDLCLIERMCGWVGLRRPTLLSSQLGIGGERSERLLNLCRHVGATTYLSGDAASAYLDMDLFHRAGIRVEWQTYRHPIYPQLHGDFVPYLSALDLILNVGPDSLDVIASGGP